MRWDRFCGWMAGFASLLALPAYWGVSTTSLANSASPFPVVVSQPDGEEVTLYLRGTEKLHWYEYVPEAADLEANLAMSLAERKRAAQPGYVVVQDGEGRYVFAKADKEGWAPTDRVVGEAAPTGDRRVMPPPQDLELALPERLPDLHIPSRSAAPVGVVKNLVVLLRFADHANRPLPSPTQFETLFNATAPTPGTAPTGSVNMFYKENSYGKLDLRSTVVKWVTLPKTEAYYADGQSGLSTRIREAIRDALDLVAADPTINLKDFDNEAGGTGDGWIDAITFVHSGYAAEFGGVSADGAAAADRIWSHRWAISPWTDPKSGVKVSDYNINPGIWGISGSNIGRIGVICHELGHFFGLPDLYDYSGKGEGIGSWCLMANSWGFDGSQLHPPHMSAWSKISLNWNTAKLINADGVYSLTPTTSPDSTIYRINYPSGSADEYLLIESRQPVGEFDGGIPAGTGGAGGLAVWHIDDLMPENDRPGCPGMPGYPTDHYKVALVQADGLCDLEYGRNRGDANDLFRAGNVSSLKSISSGSPTTLSYLTAQIKPITSISTSGATMSFRYGDGDDDNNSQVTAEFSGTVRPLDASSHASNFSQDHRAATLLFDRMWCSVYENSSSETRTASWVLPLKNPGSATGSVKAKVIARGYVSASADANVSVIVTAGGKTELLDPRDLPEGASSSGNVQQTSEAKSRLGIPSRADAIEGKSFLYETTTTVKSQNLLLTITLQTSLPTPDENGVYVAIDSLDVELVDE